MEGDVTVPLPGALGVSPNLQHRRAYRKVQQQALSKDIWWREASREVVVHATWLSSKGEDTSAHCNGVGSHGSSNRGITRKRSCVTASFVFCTEALASAVPRSTAAIFASMPDASMSSSSMSLPDVLASSC